MPEYKKKVVKELLRRSDINSNIQVVANTYMNLSYDQLTRKLSLLNSLINRKLFRWYQKYPETRVVFYCNHEKVENNTHSHIILKVPPQRDVLNVISLMSSYWEELDDRIKSKFKIYYDLNVNDEIKSTDYAIKRFNADNFIVI